MIKKKKKSYFIKKKINLIYFLKNFKKYFFLFFKIWHKVLQADFRKFRKVRRYRERREILKGLRKELWQIISEDLQKFGLQFYRKCLDRKFWAKWIDCRFRRDFIREIWRSTRIRVIGKFFRDADEEFKQRDSALHRKSFFNRNSKSLQGIILGKSFK